MEKILNLLFSIGFKEFHVVDKELNLRLFYIQYRVKVFNSDFKILNSMDSNPRYELFDANKQAFVFQTDDISEFEKFIKIYFIKQVRQLKISKLLETN